MKKSLLFISAIISGASGFAQLDTIPNPNFHSWSAATVPNNWGTSVAAYGAFGGSGSVTQVTAAPDTSLQLKTISLGGTAAPGVVISGSNASFTLVGGKPVIKGNFPYNLRPDSIKYYGKYTPSGADNGAVSVVLTKWIPKNGVHIAHRDTLAFGGGLISNTTAGWVSFPISFSTTFGGKTVIFNKGDSSYVSGAVAPDSAQIVLTSSSPLGTPVIGSILDVDSLKFVYPCKLNPAINTTGTATTGLPLPPASGGDTLTANPGTMFSQTITTFLPYTNTTAYGTATVDSTQINTSCLTVTWTDHIKGKTTSGTLTGWTITGGDANGQFPSNSVWCFTISGMIPGRTNETYTVSITPNISGTLPVIGATVNYPSPTSENYIIKVGTGDNLTSVETYNEGHFTVSQNYPNPFSGITTIQFTDGVSEKVDFFVYDLLGREVGSQVIGASSVGVNTITFSSGDLQPGTYFYTLTNGTDKVTRKMIITQ